MKSLIRKFVPELLLSWYHLGWAVFGTILYGFPTRTMVVVGVTGTDGKSTTTEMITRIFKEAGYKTCSTSSVWFQIGEKREKNRLKMGMPGRVFLQRFLRRARRERCTHAVIEVSSEGILQHRHRFLNFHTAVLTNLSPEHIERHGSFEKYRAEKEKLFCATKRIHVINLDDENVEYFLRFPAGKILLYGVKIRNSKSEVQNKFKTNSKFKILTAQDIRETKEGTDFRVDDTSFHLNLIGQFNVYNALAAICVGLVHGISLEKCREALRKMPCMPGRTEPVVTTPYTVMIDYAVTPKALANLYRGVRRLFTPRRLICVLGACGGGRDKWKRPVLGGIAAVYCDEIVLTNEDPYDEDPNQIVSQIKSGISNFQFPISKLHEILDRREAIRKAISIAQEGDMVLVTGKGSEDAIAIENSKRIPWNERKVIKEEFARLMPRHGISSPSSPSQEEEIVV